MITSMITNYETVALICLLRYYVHLTSHNLMISSDEIVLIMLSGYLLLSKKRELSFILLLVIGTLLFISYIVLQINLLYGFFNIILVIKFLYLCEVIWKMKSYDVHFFTIMFVLGLNQLYKQIHIPSNQLINPSNVDISIPSNCIAISIYLSMLIFILTILLYSFNRKHIIAFMMTSNIVIYLYFNNSLIILYKIINNIYHLLIFNKDVLSILSYWSIAIGLSILLCQYLVLSKFQKIVIRKVFHILTIILFAPVISHYEYDSFMTLSFGLALILFLILEILRVLYYRRKETHPNLYYGLLEILSKYYHQFLDRRDKLNGIILSHFYLLIGCSLPYLFWQILLKEDNPNHHFQVIRHFGWITVGLGDAVAAVYGSHFGKTKWNKTKKTIEGTIACFLSMIIVYFIISIYEGYDITSIYFVYGCLALFISSIAEVYTHENDNIIMPLVSVFVFCLASYLQLSTLIILIFFCSLVTLLNILSLHLAICIILSYTLIHYMPTEVSIFCFGVIIYYAINRTNS